MTLPSNAQFAQGHGSASADNLNTYVQYCSTVAQLRSFIGLPPMTVYLQGLSAADDGGQGMFFWLASVNHADDGQNYIIPAGANGGGWVRLGPLLAFPIPNITGTLSAVTDANAKAVMTSIIAAFVALGLATNSTT